MKTLTLSLLAALGSGDITPWETTALDAGRKSVVRAQRDLELAIEAVADAGVAGTPSVDLLDQLVAYAERAAWSVEGWAIGYLRALRDDAPGPEEFDSAAPGGTIVESEHEDLLAGFLGLHQKARGAQYDLERCVRFLADGRAVEAEEAWRRARARADRAEERTAALGQLIWTAITDPAPPDPEPDDWPTLDDVPAGAQPAQWSIERAIAQGPDEDGVYRAYLPAGRYPGVAFATGWVGPPAVDPRPLGGALLEVYGHPDGGTVISPQTKRHEVHLTPDGISVVLENGRWHTYSGMILGAEWKPPDDDAPDPSPKGAHVTLYGRGWGVSWSVGGGGGVEGWEGRVHHYDLTIEASGGNAVQVGVYCPDPDSPRVEDCRFYRCHFTGVPGVRSNRPISANYCGLGFYGCRWTYTHQTACEHGVYTRNAFWLELVDCVIDGIGAQFAQTVNRRFEFGEDCHWQPAVGGHLLIERCVFKRPGLHGGGCGGGPGSGITIAGSTWHSTIRDVVILDDGSGKNHDPGGQEGGTYGSFAVWSGGMSKTAKMPSGKPNGWTTIDGLLVWMRNPTRPIFQVSQSESLVVRNSYICGGPDTASNVELATTSGPIDWGAFDDDGRQRLIDEFGVDPADMLVPALRLVDGETKTTLGPADQAYELN